MGAPPSTGTGGPPQPAAPPRALHGRSAGQLVGWAQPLPAALHWTTLFPEHIASVESQTSALHWPPSQYIDAGQSPFDLHWGGVMHTLVAVSQSMPWGVQCWRPVVAPGALQSPSVAQSTHFLLDASQTLVPQSSEVWQVPVPVAGVT